MLEGEHPEPMPPLEGDVLPPVEWTHDYVQERLIEAMLTCWRHPDRERGWLRVRALWPDVQAEPGDFDARGGDMTSSDVALRPLAATRRDIGEMEEAFAWVEIVKPEDRKLIGLVIAWLARGRREVSWPRLLKPMGLTRGAGGLRMRYSRAITSICIAQSGGNPRAFVSSPEIDDD